MVGQRRQTISPIRKTEPEPELKSTTALVSPFNYNDLVVDFGSSQPQVPEKRPQQRPMTSVHRSLPIEFSFAQETTNAPPAFPLPLSAQKLPPRQQPLQP